MIFTFGWHSAEPAVRCREAQRSMRQIRGVLAQYESTRFGEDGMPPNIKNFLLTGRPGIGKTTVAEAIIREFEEDAGGFVTGEIRESGTRKGFRITATLKSLRS